MKRLSFGGTLLQPNLKSDEVDEKKLSFEKGLKIAADNKINVNNTWDLALIDYFADMTLLRDGEGINFQKASYTLDGCVKVYTSRIDSFETETRKLLLGLADKNSNSDNPEEENPSSLGEDGNSKQNKRRKQLATTLEDNAALTADALELDFAADPLFQKTAADFDEGGAKGLLLSHLDISTAGKIIFDASDVLSSNNMPPALVSSDEKIDMDGLIAKFGSKFSNMNAREICPTFSTFLFNSDILQDFNIDSINKDDFYFNDAENDYSDYDDLPNEMYQVGPNQEPVFIPPILPQMNDFNTNFDDDMPMMDEDGRGFPDSDSVTLNHVAEQEGGMVMKQRGASSIMVPTSHFITDENTVRLFDTGSSQNWAGPQFWKSRSLKVSDPSATKQARAPAKKKDKVVIDFVNSDRLEREKVFAKSSTSITLPKSKTRANNQDLHLLPDDLQFNSDRLLKLFLKPDFKIRTVLESIMSCKEPGDPDLIHDQSQQLQEGEEYVYGGFEEVDDEVPDDLPSTLPTGFGVLPGDSISEPHSTQEPVPIHDFAEINDDYGHLTDAIPSEEEASRIDSSQTQQQVLSNLSSLSINLKGEGVKLKQKTIPLYFARTAKRVDVAKLKENLWHKLVEGEQVKQEDELESEYPEKPGKKVVHEEEMNPVLQEPKSFTHIVSELDDCYAERARKDISVAFCFICVLHLANENNLKITSQGMKELVITANSS